VIPSASPVQLSTDLEPLIARWEGMSYIERRRHIWHSVRPREPHFRYKYLVLVPENERSIAKVRDLIVESRMYLSDPTRFNDPFDMKARVVFDGTLEQRRQKFRALIANKSGGRRKERKRLLNEFMSRPTEEWLSAIEGIFAQSVRAVGVFSMAGDPRSILMWSHYALNHTGLCVQLEIAHDPRAFALSVPIDYEDSYPTLNYLDPDWGAHVRNVLKTKHPGWEYEKEWRIVHMNGANSYYAFKPAVVSGIILGSRMPNGAIDVVQQLLSERSARGHPKVSVFQAQEHREKYKLVVKRRMSRVD
jgi:hypothetical protein